MKYKDSFEGAICIVLLLANDRYLQKISSNEISELMQSSNAYTKKILANLVRENVIASDTGKGGGYYLIKNTDDISLLDIYYAIEGKTKNYHPKHLADNFLEGASDIRSGEEEVASFMEKAEQAYLQRLNSYKISQLIRAHRPERSHT